MKTTKIWGSVLGLGFLAAALGCSDKASDQNGASAQGGTGGGGGAARGGYGPAITAAPAAWERPADCGGIGDNCAGILSCGTRSMCQSMGNVCIPALATGATSMPSKSAEHPYCAAYTCMSFEEASCFCTGAAASTNTSCASPAQLAGLCVGQGYSCATSSCCNGLSCVHGVGTAMVCEKACATNADCEGGCCTDLRDTGDLVCAKAAACTTPCKKTAETCTPGTSTTPNDCCQGSCVQSTNPNTAGCRQQCTKDADCVKTGCCRPYSDGTYGFCVDAALFCSCGAEGAACGTANTPDCCAGTKCTGTLDGGFVCNKQCVTASDCASKCCIAVSTGEFSVCKDAATYCPAGS